MKETLKIHNVIWLMVVLLLAYSSLFLLEGSFVAERFNAISGQNIRDEFIALFLFETGLIGAYLFLILNILRWFKDSQGLVVLFLFSFMLIILCLYFVNLIMNMQVDLEYAFNRILFPTDPDLVAKNIKIDILNKTIYMLLSIMVTGIVFFIVGLGKFIQLKVNSVENPRSIAKN